MRLRGRKALVGVALCGSMLSLTTSALATDHDGVEQEGVILPMLDRYEHTRQSLLAQESGDNINGVVGGGLGVGPRRDGDFRGPFTTIGLFGRMGAFGSPATLGDVSSTLSARFKLPGIEGEAPQSFDIAGRHRFALHLGMVDVDGFYLDLAPHEALTHSSSGTWGEREVDVAPEPFVDFRGGASLWLSHGSHGGPNRPTTKALELRYEARNTAYINGPLDGPRRERNRTVHEVSLGAGMRELNDNTFRLHMLFLKPKYVTTYSTLSPVRWHRFDYHVVDISMQGIETDELSGLLEARLGGSMFMKHGGGAPIHTADMRFALRFDAPGVLDAGLAVGHAPGFDPTGGRPLGLTTFETHIVVEPEPHHYGVLARGRIDRVVDIDTGHDDAWRGTLTGELYARIFGVKLGAATRLSYGEPTGSMGWNPFVDEARWSGYVGGFVRGAACFSSRCGLRVTKRQP